MEWLNFIATELHKQFGPLWYPTTPDATKDAQKAKLATRFDLLAKTLAAQPYLTGRRSRSPTRTCSRSSTGRRC